MSSTELEHESTGASALHNEVVTKMMALLHEPMKVNGTHATMVVVESFLCGALLLAHQHGLRWQSVLDRMEAAVGERVSRSLGEYNESGRELGTERFLNKLASRVDAALNHGKEGKDHTGFCLIIAPPGQEQHAVYASNIRREDSALMLQCILARWLAADEAAARKATLN